VVVYGDNGLYFIAESDSPPQLTKTLKNLTQKFKELPPYP